MATELQELPPASKCPTAEPVATQLALHLATICARSKLFHVVPLFALFGGIPCMVLGVWGGVAGALTQGSQRWHN